MRFGEPTRTRRSAFSMRDDCAGQSTTQVLPPPSRATLETNEVTQVSNREPDGILDQYLVTLAQAGSRDAFERLARRWQVSSLAAALRSRESK
jgi:hypothetical protein